jgi:hypothetical protein
MGTFLRWTDVKEFDAGLAKRYPKEMSIINGTLQLQAIIVDEIAAVGPTMDRNVAMKEHISSPRAQYAQFLDMVKVAFSYYAAWRAIARPIWGVTYKATGEPMRQAFALTFLLNQLPLTANLTSLRRVDRGTHVVHFVTSVAHHVNSIPQPHFLWRATSFLGISLMVHGITLSMTQGVDLWAAWTRAPMGRAMFRTKSEYLGMAGRRVLRGDVVTIVRGSKAPVVMRRKGGAASGKWELVGDAYVHGIMRGEAVECGILLLSSSWIRQERWKKPHRVA